MKKTGNETINAIVDLINSEDRTRWIRDDDLQISILDLHWGAVKDAPGWFKTINSSACRNIVTITIWYQRRRVVATNKRSVSREPSSLLVWSRADREDDASRTKELNREAQKAYQAARQKAQVLLMSGKALAWYPGQKGGILEDPLLECRVGAEGAMRGLIPQNEIDMLLKKDEHHRRLYWGYEWFTISIRGKYHYGKRVSRKAGASKYASIQEGLAEL
jgi:hypothetical protein